MAIEASHMGIAHAYGGSLLYRAVRNDGVAFEKFAEELHGSEIEDRLALGGFLEVRQTTSPVHLAPPRGSLSPTYELLVSKQYDRASVSTSYAVDALDRSLDSFEVELMSSYGTGHAQISLLEGEYFIQKAPSYKQMATAEPVKVDDIVAKQLIKDVVLQAGHDPRDLSENTTTENLLALLSSKAGKLSIERQTDHRWDELATAGYNMEINFRQKTIFSRGHILPQHMAEIGVTSVLPLDTRSSTSNLRPFSSTRLRFASTPRGNSGTLQAGLGNITPAQYDITERERLLLGTYNQLAQPYAFTERLTSALARLAWTDNLDISSL